MYVQREAVYARSCSPVAPPSSLSCLAIGISSVGYQAACCRNYRIFHQIEPLERLLLRKVAKFVYLYRPLQSTADLTLRDMPCHFMLNVTGLDMQYLTNLVSYLVDPALRLLVSSLHMLDRFWLSLLWGIFLDLLFLYICWNRYGLLLSSETTDKQDSLNDEACWWSVSTSPSYHFQPSHNFLLAGLYHCIDFFYKWNTWSAHVFKHPAYCDESWRAFRANH